MFKLDPWEPDSFNEASIDGLIQWLRELPAADLDMPEEKKAAKELDPDKAEQLLASLLTTGAENFMAEAIGCGESMMPFVLKRLAKANELSDSHHVILRELRYRLAAGEKTRLEEVALLKALSSLNPIPIDQPQRR